MSSADANATKVMAPADDRAHVLFDLVREELGADLVGSEVRRGDVWVRVRPEGWLRAAEACKRLGFDYFCYLSGIDWMPSTAPNPRAGVPDTVEGVEDEPEPEPAEPEPDAPAATDGWQTGYAGGDTRFQVLARLYSVTRHQGVTLKADLDEADPHVATWSEVYPGADWNERETWEMYGFRFEGHPNLIKLYLPGEFEGFPLRKDFPLLSREVKPWPGLVDVEPMPDVPEVADAPDGAEPEATG